MGLPSALAKLRWKLRGLKRVWCEIGGEQRAMRWHQGIFPPLTWRAGGGRIGRMKSSVAVLFLSLAVCCVPGRAQVGKSSDTVGTDKTFGELRAANALPKWATNVCFVETVSDEHGTKSDFSWNAAGHDATDFIVYGPKGDFHIQTQEYVAGKPTAYYKWDRQKDSPDGASNFLTVTPASKHHEGVGLNLRLSWTPKPSFTMVWSSLSSGQSLLNQSGRCRALNDE
jgi:hypothetical protein